VGMLVDQIRDAPDDLGSLTARQLGPDAGLEGRLRRRDGFVDRVFDAVGEFRDGLFGCWIDDRNDITRAGSLTDFVQDFLQRHLIPSKASTSNAEPLLSIVDVARSRRVLSAAQESRALVSSAVR